MIYVCTKIDNAFLLFSFSDLLLITCHKKEGSRGVFWNYKLKVTTR